MGPGLSHLRPAMDEDEREGREQAGHVVLTVSRKAICQRRPGARGTRPTGPLLDLDAAVELNVLA